MPRGFDAAVVRRRQILQQREQERKEAEERLVRADVMRALSQQRLRDPSGAVRQQPFRFVTQDRQGERHAARKRAIEVESRRRAALIAMTQATQRGSVGAATDRHYAAASPARTASPPPQSSPQSRHIKHRPSPRSSPRPAPTVAARPAAAARVAPPDVSARPAATSSPAAAGQRARPPPATVVQVADIRQYQPRWTPSPEPLSTAAAPADDDAALDDLLDMPLIP